MCAAPLGSGFSLSMAPVKHAATTSWTDVARAPSGPVFSGLVRIVLHVIPSFCRATAVSRAGVFRRIGLLLPFAALDAAAVTLIVTEEAAAIELAAACANVWQVADRAFMSMASNRLISMTIRARLASMTSNAGDKVEFSSAGVTCLVGGNNAGKSQTLSDIAALARTPQSSPIVLTELRVDKPAPISLEEAESFLKTTAVEQPQASLSANKHYVPLGDSGTALTADYLQNLLTHGGDVLSDTAPFFLQHWTAGQLSNQAIASLGHPHGISPSSPLHQLFIDGDLEEELSNISYEAFEEHLTLDRTNMDVRLRVGKVTDVPIPPLNHPTRAYADAVAALPSLAVQGDGVRSFIGLVMAVLVGRWQILLIDEPEAFLHPGQARALGRWVSSQAKQRDIQIVVSTHDRDFVLGLLEGTDDSVRFVRIVRAGKNNHFHELRPEEVNATWSDPVLRYSNVLQGLFHRRVVICEADADCRFYGAVLDEMADELGLRSQIDDLLLVPSGGKAGVATLARALGKLGVETHAFVDFDVLNNKETIKGIVDAVGGAWTEAIDGDFLGFVQPVQQGSLWKTVKSQGLAGVPSGPPYLAAEGLLRALDELRVHVVPSGEMESFDRSIGVHGPAWVSEALKRNMHKSSQPAKDYVSKVLSR